MKLRVAACQILTFPDPKESADKVMSWMKRAAGRLGLLRNDECGVMNDEWTPGGAVGLPDRGAACGMRNEETPSPGIRCAGSEEVAPGLQRADAHDPEPAGGVGALRGHAFARSGPE